MKLPWTFLVGVGLSCLPSVSAAQGLFAAPAPRFRFGVAAGASLSRALTTGDGVETLDVTLDLGAQLNDRTALFAHVAGGWWQMTHRASVSAVIELTTVDLLSFGAGVGWDHFVDDNTARCLYVDPNRYTCGHRVWNGLSIPLIVSLNLGGRSTDSARRRGLRLSLEGALGIDPRTGEGAAHASVALGYVAM